MSKRFNWPAFVLFVVCVLASVTGWTIGGYPLSAEDRGTPKFRVGGQYHAVYSCMSTPVAPEVSITTCYEEIWLLLATGKDGWLRVAVMSTNGKSLSKVEEYWVNVNRLSAIRESITSAPTEETPNPHTTPVIPEKTETI